MLRLISLLLIVLFLSACATPNTLGISKAEWNNYSPVEREKIKSGYYAILRGEGKIKKSVSDGSRVQVKISGGKIKLPPFANLENYIATNFLIRDGQCKTVQISEATAKNTIPMKVCYLNKTLYLDPSRYEIEKSVGSIQLHYSPIWDRSFTYKDVSSSGYVHLTGVNITVARFLNDS